ncbi:MAG: hypothetical protein ORO03_03745 [Alphaproteobacteria bacterium]|nr:hypothetical protein [Alphaproteobacteria bacterium]
MLIISFIIFIFSVAYFGFSYYYQNNSVLNDNILINFNINRLINSNQEDIASISVMNYNKLPLNNAVLKISYQVGKYKNGDINIVNKYITIGDISYNQNFSTNTDFIFYGSEGETRNIYITLEYTLSNGEVFSKKISDYISISTNNISLNISPGQNVSKTIENNIYNFVIKIKNTDINSIKDSFLLLSLPKDFVLNNKINRNIIPIDKLDTGVERVYNFSGYFSNLVSDTKIFRVILYNKDNIFLKDNTLELDNINSPLSVNVDYEKDFSKVNLIKPNTNYKMKLHISNNSEDAYINSFIRFKDDYTDIQLNDTPLTFFSGKTQDISLDIKTSDTINYTFNISVTGRKKGETNDDILLNRDLITRLAR